MRNERELSEQIAKMLCEARARSGMSISAVAEAIGKDDKTYSNWEKGKSAPTVPMLIRCFEAMDEPLLRPILGSLYPEEFEYSSLGSTPTQKKKSLIKYIDEVASDEEIEKLSFLMFGQHGSSWKHQLEGFVALEHLPMYARVLVAQIIATNFDLIETRGQLLNQNYIMPNMEKYREGLGLGYDAVTINKNKYTETK